MEVKVKKGKLEHKKHHLASKMAKTLDSAHGKGFPKHGGDVKHGKGLTKGYSF